MNEIYETVIADGECNDAAPYPDCHDVLCCWLAEGHEGPHHDTAGKVMWLDGPRGVSFWPEGEEPS